MDYPFGPPTNPKTHEADYEVGYTFDLGKLSVLPSLNLYNGAEEVNGKSFPYKIFNPSLIVMPSTPINIKHIGEITPLLEIGGNNNGPWNIEAHEGINLTLPKKLLGATTSLNADRYDYWGKFKETGGTRVGGALQWNTSPISSVTARVYHEIPNNTSGYNAPQTIFNVTFAQTIK